jgi:GT2 family glycosyltransferase
VAHLHPAPSEIIVVDNAPAGGETRHLVAQIPSVRYVLEPRPGLSAARNTGITESTGDLIAFTDDDAMPEAGWLGALQRGLTDPAIACVTGATKPYEVVTAAQQAFEEYWSFDRGPEQKRFDPSFLSGARWRYPKVWEIGGGGNMIVRRSAFEAVGGFDERLGAGAAGCSEDTELFYRFLAEGYSCSYRPDAVIYHEHRQDELELRRQLYSYMKGHSASLLMQLQRYPSHWSNLGRLAWTLPYGYLRLLAIGLLRGFGPRQRTILAEARGCVAGVKWFVGHRTPVVPMVTPKVASTGTTIAPPGSGPSHPDGAVRQGAR